MTNMIEIETDLLKAEMGRVIHDVIPRLEPFGVAVVDEALLTAARAIVWKDPLRLRRSYAELRSWRPGIGELR